MGKVRVERVDNPRGGNGYTICVHGVDDKRIINDKDVVNSVATSFFTDFLRFIRRY